jgi:hypothetical protein
VRKQKAASADGAVGAPFVFGSGEKSKIKGSHCECRRERYKKMSERERERERGCCGEKERQADWIYEHTVCVHIAVAAAYPMGVTQSENKPSLHKGKTRGQNTHKLTPLSLPGCVEKRGK